MIKYFYVLSIFLLVTSELSFSSEYEKNIGELEKYIGAFPPNIDSNKTKTRIVKLYEKTKTSLDQELLKAPKSEELLFQRGALQSMGHNMDYHDAWKGAESDLKALLTLNPNHIAGIQELGNLYVNTGPEFSERAINLFLAAQCLSGEVPNEVAQRGLFFALYYQGKIPEAYKQLQILNKYWPNNDNYTHLEKMMWDRFAKAINSSNLQKPGKIAFISCEKAKDT